MNEDIPTRTPAQAAWNLCALCAKNAEPNDTICSACREERVKVANIVIRKHALKSFAVWTLGTAALAAAGWLAHDIAGNKGLALVVFLVVYVNTIDRSRK